jgi:hypothetical protein
VSLEPSSASIWKSKLAGPNAAEVGLITSFWLVETSCAPPPDTLALFGRPPEALESAVAYATILSVSSGATGNGTAHRTGTFEQ